MNDFRVKLLLFFIAICAVFFLAIKILYAVDLSSLSLEKIETIQDEYYIMDLTQEQWLADTGEYKHMPTYNCSGYTCRVDTYLAPPYASSDIGYILYIDTGVEQIINSTGKLKNSLDKIYEKTSWDTNNTDFFIDSK